MIRYRFALRRPWVFTKRYYSPGGWRVPRPVWRRLWNREASGKAASIQLSYLHGIYRTLRYISGRIY